VKTNRSRIWSLSHEKREFRSWSHTEEIQKLRSWSHVHDEKSAGVVKSCGAGAMFMMRRAPE